VPIITVSCRFKGNSEVARGRSRKIAEQYAVKKWMETSGDQLKAEKAKVQDRFNMIGFATTYLQRAQQQPILALNNFCQKYHKAKPTFKDSFNPEPDVAVQWTASIEIAGCGRQAAIADARTKNQSGQAKNNSAKLLLTKLIHFEDERRKKEGLKSS